MSTSVIPRLKPYERVPGRPVRALSNHPVTESLPLPKTENKPINAELIRRHIRSMGITEDVLIHEQNYQQFLDEKGITELGRGGEGAVYFLRGHVVKVVNPICAPAALREIVHMLHLNRMQTGGAMGERSQQDWPALLWVYSLSDGSVSIGMKPFDAGANAVPGATLYERLKFGPPMDRVHVLQSIYSVARSLVYAHNNGILHHDLKPANIYIPADPAQAPVVFDLGQALWRHNSWGRRWLKHEHNLHYWYNGTYRYMHSQRRLAHLAALAVSRRLTASSGQTHAFERYVPTFYDDVCAYARIVRDIVGSPNVALLQADRAILRAFYQRLMGLERSRRRGAARVEPNHDSGLVRRLKSMFGSPTPQPLPAIIPIEQRLPAMDAVMPELDKLMAGLLGPIFKK